MESTGELHESDALSPDELLEIARACATPDRLRAIVENAAIVARGTDGAAAAARAFIREVWLPKDTSKSDDRRYKAVVFCSFDQLNEINTLKARVAELEAMLAQKASS